MANKRGVSLTVFVIMVLVLELVLVSATPRGDGLPMKLGGFVSGGVSAGLGKVVSPGAMLVLLVISLFAARNH